MLKQPPRRRRGQCGQVLAIALAFNVFFGIIVVVTFHLANNATLQHRHTETAASSDSIAEGGTIFAAQDASQSTGQCAPSTQGTLVMAQLSGSSPGDTLHYTTNACDPVPSALNQPLAFECVLCLLGGTTTDLNFQTAKGRTLAVNGPVTIKGGASVGSKDILASTSAPALIACGGPCIGGPTAYNPPVTPITFPVVDPLAALPTPSLSGGCMNVDSSSTQTLTAGIYCDITLSGGANITFSPGTYVITGSFTVAGNASVSSPSGAFFYFACASYPTCTSRGPGAFFQASGSGGSLTFTPPSAGPYAGVSFMFDHNNTGSGGLCVMCISGNGGTIGGTVYTTSGAILLTGGGNGNSGQVTIDGALIANTLSITVNGNTGPGLTLTGKSTGRLCSVYDISATGTPAGSSTSAPSHAIVESACNGGSDGVHIVDINYQP